MRRVSLSLPMGEESPERPGTAAANTAWTVVSLLFAGILAWGGIGWLADRWLDTQFFLPIGILFGAAGALYLVIKRFGRMTSDQDTDGKT